MRWSEAWKLRGIIEQAMDGGVDDAAALEAVTLFPAWDSAASYEAGRRVRYEGVLYRCLQSHTAQADWTPTDTPSLWAKVLIPDENTIPEWEQPDSTNPYMRGDKVTHHGTTWVSGVDNNVWEPGVYGWTEMSE